jgi:putative addiction module component (TIGR02574 family)
MMAGELAMNVDQTISALSALPICDRLRVVHAIWDTLPDDVDLSVTPKQQVELDRRLAAHRDDPSTAISHDELMRRVENRR